MFDLKGILIIFILSILGLSISNISCWWNTFGRSWCDGRFRSGVSCHWIYLWTHWAVPPGFKPLWRGWVYRPAPEASLLGECRRGSRHFWNHLNKRPCVTLVRLVGRRTITINYIFILNLISRFTFKFLGASGRVMVNELDKQTCKSEFESHWVSRSFGLVPQLSKKLSKFLLSGLTIIQRVFTQDLAWGKCYITEISSELQINFKSLLPTKWMNK